ncbi:MAG TPA: hypothetical protein VMN60_00670 [Longimicrobiales bacterium]|nr:hypothetical protein [Longimicrobiales bacterium]
MRAFRIARASGTDDEAPAGVDWIELPPVGRRRSAFSGTGLTRQQRRWFDRGIVALVASFAMAWCVAVVHAVNTGTPLPGAAAVTTSPLAFDARPPAPRLLDAALQAFVERAGYGGYSGQVQVVVQEPGEAVPLPTDSVGAAVTVEFVPDNGDSAAAVGTVRSPGVWNVLLRMRGGGERRVPRLAVLALTPLSEKRDGRIGRYIIGNWPNERGGTPRSDAYRPPRGMVRVTPENLDLAVSRHFRLRHFVTKGQEHVWPKYVLLSPRLLDKLELTIDELNRSGTPVQRVGVISGFRTPNYNAGGGDTGGRGALSRHMYGDAMDWFVDNNGDGRMDDLNGDGRIDTGDGRVIVEAAERVERQYPDLVGGIGLYRPTGAHSGFVHVDTRGYRARW